MSTVTGERRPIAARHWNISRTAAQRLAQFGATPNAISIAGLAFGLAAGVMLAATSSAGPWAPALWLAAALGISLRLLCNMLDGMVAVEGGKATKLGELLNEVPDRVADSAILIGLGFAAGGQVALGFVAALAAMFTAYVRVVGKAAGASQDFCGPMAKPQRMAVVIAVALLCTLASHAWLPAAALSVIIAGCVVTSLCRLRRIAGSLRKEAP